MSGWAFAATHSVPTSNVAAININDMLFIGHSQCGRYAVCQSKFHHDAAALPIVRGALDLSRCAD